MRFGPTPKLTGDQVGELRRERGRRLDQESDGEIRDESGEYLSIAVTGKLIANTGILPTTVKCVRHSGPRIHFDVVAGTEEMTTSAIIERRL